MLRRGRRAARGGVVVHLMTGETTGEDDGVRVGFVVSRAVGSAVCRNQVMRRLRHLVRERLSRLPAGARVVVRAVPAAAGRTSADLGADLDAALSRLAPTVGPVPSGSP